METPIPERKRRQALWAAVKWWWTGEGQPENELRSILAEHPPSAVAPKETFDWSRARPEGFSGDGRWWLLARSKTNHQSNHTNVAHCQVAVACAWLRNAPNVALRQWGVELFEAQPVMAGRVIGNREAKFQLGLKAALEWEKTATKSNVSPIVVSELSPSEAQWALSWAAAIGDTQTVIAIAGSPKELLDIPMSEPLPWLGWLTLFDRHELLGMTLDAGANVNTPLDCPQPIFEKAKGIAKEWKAKLERLRDDPMDPENKPALRQFEALTPAWNGFTAARWAIAFDHPKILAKLIEHGVKINEFGESAGSSPMAVALEEMNWEVALQLLQAGVCVTSHEGFPEYVVEKIAEAENAVRLHPHNIQANAQYRAMIEPLRSAFRRENLGARENAWGACLYEAIDNNAPLLAKAILDCGKDNSWKSWINTKTDGHGKKTVVSFAQRAIKVSADGSDNVLSVLAGRGMDINEPLSTDIDEPIGLFIAACAPGSLKAWLDASSPQPIHQLLQARSASDENKRLRKAFRNNADLWAAALEGVDPGSAVEALASHQDTKSSWIRSPYDVHELALSSAGQGNHAALEAVLRLLPPPKWTPDDLVTGWVKVLERPFDVKIVQQAIHSWPVDVQVGKKGNTPLHFAVHNEDAQLISWLLAAGANPDRANNEGLTPRKMCDDNPLMSKAIAEGQSDMLDETIAAAPARTTGRAARL
jgi:hypothetical protein